MSSPRHTNDLESLTTDLQITYQKGLLAMGFKPVYSMLRIQTLLAEPSINMLKI